MIEQIDKIVKATLYFLIDDAMAKFSLNLFFEHIVYGAITLESQSGFYCDPIRLSVRVDRNRILGICSNIAFTSQL